MSIITRKPRYIKDEKGREILLCIHCVNGFEQQFMVYEPFINGWFPMDTPIDIVLKHIKREEQEERDYFAPLDAYRLKKSRKEFGF